MENENENEKRFTLRMDLDLFIEKVILWKEEIEIQFIIKTSGVGGLKTGSDPVGDSMVDLRISVRQNRPGNKNNIFSF